MQKKMKINQKLINDFIKTLNVSDKGIKTRKNVLSKFKSYEIDHNILNDRFEQVYKKNAQSTKNTYRKYVNQLIEYVNKTYNQDIAKLKEIRIYAISNNNLDPLSYYEYLELLKHSNNKYRNAIFIQYTLGLRARELYQITYEYLRTKDSLNILNKGVYRTIFIPSQLRELAVDEKHKTGVVLKRSYTAYNRYINDLANKFLGKNVTTHALRRLRATMLHEAGIDIITIKDLLGHDSIETTKDYIYSNNERIKSALEIK